MRIGSLICGGIAALIVAMTTSAKAETRTLRFQSAYPASSTIYMSAETWAKRVEELSGGRLKIEFMPAGTIVPAFEVLDAVNKNVIDGGHSTVAYWVGKHRAGTLFGDAAGGPFGMDILDYVGWLYEGGGIELYRDYYRVELKTNIEVIPSVTSANQALGWFARPVESWADLKGRKCRQTGVTAEVFASSGMSTVNMPGGEIVPAGERGVIECAEFVGPAEDMGIGFQTIWKHFYPMSTHNPATIVDFLVNGDVWNSLAPDLQAIMQAAASEATLRSHIRKGKLDADALDKMRNEDGVTVHRTPDDVLQNILASWDEIAKKESEDNAFFKKVYDSQRDYASKVVPAKRLIQAPYNLSADHYWPEAK